MKNEHTKKTMREIIGILILLSIFTLSACSSKVDTLGPNGQEYVSRWGGSLTVESPHKISLWDGRGLPNTFTIKKGYFYNEYGGKVVSIRKQGENIIINSSNSNVRSAYGGTYKPYEGHFKGYQRLR